MAQKQSQKEKPKKRHAPASDERSRGSILDDTTKRDILGVVFIIAAIAFLLVVALPSDGALVSSVAAEYLKLVFGVGAYILPLVLATIGATFLYRTQKERVPARAALGLTIIFIGLLGFIALFAPIQSLGHDDLTLLFTRTTLMGYSGYIGSGIAFCLISGVGKIVAGVILIGVMIVGIVIVGFSISKTIELVKKKQHALRERLSAERENSDSLSRFARVRKAPEVSLRHAPHQALLSDAPILPQDLDDPGITRPLMRTAPDASAPRRALGDATVSSEPARPNEHEPAPLVDRTPGGSSCNTIPITLEAPADPLPSSAAPPHIHSYEREAKPDQAVYAGRNSSLYAPLERPVRTERVESNPFPARLPIIGAAAQTATEYDDDDEDFSFDPERWSYDPVAQPPLPETDEDIEIPSFLRSDTPPTQEGSVAEPRGFVQPHVVKLDHLELLDGTTVPVFNTPRARTLDITTEDADQALHVFDEPDTAEANEVRTPTEVVGSTVSVEAPAHVSATPKASSRRSASAKRTKRTSSPSPSQGFVLPDPRLLTQPDRTHANRSDDRELSQTAATLQGTLEDFGIQAKVVGWIAGPTVTLFKVDLPSGVRVSRVTNLNDDIALSLAAPGVRIFAPIPGTNHVGIEVPNKARQTVLLSEVLKDAPDGPLQIAIGKDVEGNSIVSDLAKMPHLLIGGTTGSGKSVSINAMIMSILMRATPAEVRFIMIDPKRVEFTPYNGIPHLYVPVVTEPKEAASALSWGVAEMERRLKVFSAVGARNIGQYNAKVASGALKDDDPDAQELPYIVIIIDELADLMMNVGKEVEFSISRIAQLARAAGIHLIVATQRPSTNVVTGLIKANITNRIAFNVASGIDSRVILDTPGAESLIGLGDMLLSKPEFAKPQRIQACYVSEDEINAVVDFIKDQGEAEYHQEILTTNLITLGSTNPAGGNGGDDDPLLWDAADVVVSTKIGSTSQIQRRFKVGYSRAGRIMDQLEEKGVVGPANGSKPREVLVDEMELETIKAFEQSDL